MTSYFAEKGWKDIKIAFPTNILEIKRINELARSTELGLLVDSRKVTSFLSDNLEHSVNLWVKIDTGYKRAGIDWSDDESVLKIAEEIQRSENCTFQGILTQAGHVYEAEAVREVKYIHRTTVDRRIEVKDKLLRKGLSRCRVSIGNTPACSVFEGL